MSTFDNALVRLYRERGLLTADDRPVHLSSGCPRAVACWAGQAPERHPKVDSPAAALSPPHVGSRFEEGRLVVLLENLRDYGGWDLGPQAKVGMRFLAGHARDDLAKGKRLLFRGHGYPGTHVWHRAAQYAATWLAVDGFSGDPSAEAAATDLAEAMDCIAVVQHVKCSPVGGRSEQTATMWTECGPHVLAGELALLKPRRMIVLGQGDNTHAVRGRILPELREVVSREVVKLGRRQARIEVEKRLGPSGEVDVLFVPHPAMPGGTARKLVDAVRTLLANSRVTRTA